MRLRLSRWATTRGKAGVVDLLRRMVRWRVRARPCIRLLSCFLGVAIAGWQLPLMAAGRVDFSDTVLIFAAVTVFNWVFNNTNGSVLIMLMHAEQLMPSQRASSEQEDFRAVGDRGAAGGSARSKAGSDLGGRGSPPKE